MAEQRTLWLKGTLTGTCLGKPTRKRGGSGLARWYQLELVEAVISDWEPVAGPPSGAAKKAGEAPFCQATLEDARLRARVPGQTDEALALRELSVWNWKMRDQREAGGESRCTLVGTVYAQEVLGTRRPVLADDADRLGGWGCLAVLAGLLVASWLWWGCGPFTCGLWASVVLASWWSHRMRTRRRTPPGIGSQIIQAVLALLLIVGGVGLTLGLRDPSRVSACGDPTASLAVLIAVAGVVGASLLSVSWPLPWMWTLWTIIMVLWCGRADTDCARLWLRQAQDAVKGAPLPQSLTEPPQLLPQLLPPSPRGGEGRGEGFRKMDGGESDDGGSDSGGSSSDGRGSGGAGSGGAGSGGTGSGTTGNGEDDDTLEAQREPRMSVDQALSDPKAFLDGTSRVTLSGDLLFQFDEDTLKPGAEVKLQQVARLIRLQPARRVLLEGHADTVGGEQYNQSLSERRAEAVRAWLVEQAHLNPMQIDTVGYGSARPIVPASRSPSEQGPNRRVEVLLQ